MNIKLKLTLVIFFCSCVLFIGGCALGQSYFVSPMTPKQVSEIILSNKITLIGEVSHINDNSTLMFFKRRSSISNVSEIGCLSGYNQNGKKYITEMSTGSAPQWRKLSGNKVIFLQLRDMNCVVVVDNNYVNTTKSILIFYSDGSSEEVVFNSFIPGYYTKNGRNLIKRIILLDVNGGKIDIYPNASN